MSWSAVDVMVREESRGAVAEWLVGRTGQAVEERDDGTLVAFAPGGAAADALLTDLRQAFGGVAEGSARTLARVDWTEQWRAGLEPRRIGRLTVSPSWCALPASDLPPIIIDPETAFGTGEHGSTRTALALLDRHLRPGSRVLDLGSGSAILAIAAARLGASRVTGIEVDEEAEPVALGNVARNGVSGVVSLMTGDAAALAPLLGPVEVVLSNILRHVNISLLPAIRASLVPGGLAIFAGMEQPERAVFLPELAAGGFTAVDEAIDEGWWGVAARGA